MSGITKFVVAEQVLFRLAGGVPDTNFPVQHEDVYKALEQKVNSLFKLKHFDTTLPSGETMPDNAMIATYTDVAVTADGQRSKATLPIIPISLPKSAGIALVYSTEGVPFIPVQRGQMALLRTDSLLNDLMGQIAYEPKNNTVTFSKDITLLGISTVTMELCVLDVSQYSVTQTLPIPADMEQRVIDELVQQFSPVTAESGVVNPFTTAAQNQVKQ